MFYLFINLGSIFFLLASWLFWSFCIYDQTEIATFGHGLLGILAGLSGLFCLYKLYLYWKYKIEDVDVTNVVEV